MKLHVPGFLLDSWERYHVGCHPSEWNSCGCEFDRKAHFFYSRVGQLIRFSRQHQAPDLATPSQVSPTLNLHINVFPHGLCSAFALLYYRQHFKTARLWLRHRASGCGRVERRHTSTPTTAHYVAPLAPCQPPPKSWIAYARKE